MNNCSFIFKFDYNIRKHYPIEKGDEIIIRGTFKEYSKRFIPVFDYEKKKTGEKYWEDVEWRWFKFKKPEILGTHGHVYMP
jgi:hypothetical protein